MKIVSNHVSNRRERIGIAVRRGNCTPERIDFIFRLAGPARDPLAARDDGEDVAAGAEQVNDYEGFRSGEHLLSGALGPYIQPSAGPAQQGVALVMVLFVSGTPQHDRCESPSVVTIPTPLDFSSVAFHRVDDMTVSAAMRAPNPIFRQTRPF